MAILRKVQAGAAICVLASGLQGLPSLCDAIEATAAEYQLTSDESDFFERNVRPILVERCYRCHNSADTAQSGLALDHRAGLRRGGKRGPVIDEDNVAGSLLLRAVRHELDDLRMPKDDGKLSDED